MTRGAVCTQNELSRNHCRPQRIDIWQQAVDTDVFNPAFRSQEMRARMSGGKPDSVILTYVGRLGAGGQPPSCRPLKPGCVTSTGWRRRRMGVMVLALSCSSGSVYCHAPMK